MQKLVYDHIPGLFVYLDCFSKSDCEALLRRSLDFYDRLEAATTRAGELTTAHIPQPEYVRSAEHNLPSEERFARVVLEESNGRKLRCEYFPKYGEEGHSLAYCRGNDHLPDFIRDHWIAPIHQLVIAAGLVDPSRNLTWKLTTNFYRTVGGTIAGFPFHVDIPANGVVTMILNVHREALFQITRGEVIADIQMAVGSLLILSGESRYEWKHRVLPMVASGDAEVGKIERVSLVLGFQ